MNLLQMLAPSTESVISEFDSVSTVDTSVKSNDCTKFLFNFKKISLVKSFWGNLCISRFPCSTVGGRKPSLSVVLFPPQSAYAKRKEATAALVPLFPIECVATGGCEVRLRWLSFINCWKCCLNDVTFSFDQGREKTSTFTRYGETPGLSNRSSADVILIHKCGTGWWTG